jgi:hypothetical protein
MKHRKVSVSWQNAKVELSRKEQVVKSRLKTEDTRATHEHIIEKTNTNKQTVDHSHGLS